MVLSVSACSFGILVEKAGAFWSQEGSCQNVTNDPVTLPKIGLPPTTTNSIWRHTQLSVERFPTLPFYISNEHIVLPLSIVDALVMPGDGRPKRILGENGLRSRPSYASRCLAARLRAAKDSMNKYRREQSSPVPDVSNDWPRMDLGFSHHQYLIGNETANDSVGERDQGWTRSLLNPQRIAR